MEHTGTAGWPDLIRTIALVAGAFLVAVTLVVGWAYGRVYSRHVKAARAGRVPPWRGMLPRHVVVIALSHVILVVVTMTVLIDRVRDDSLTWLGPTCLLGYLLGLWAMWDVLGNTRYRSRDLDERGA